MRIIVNNYNVFNKYVSNNGIKIVLISDIHFSSISKYQSLVDLKNKIDEIDPDYICIVGDIIDSQNVLDDDKLINSFYKWLYDLSAISKEKNVPVLLSLGNHDMSYKYVSHNRVYYDESPLYDEFKRKLNSKNTHLLDNSYYEDDSIFVGGFTQPRDVFHNSNGGKDELKYYDSLPRKMINPSGNKLKIALIHSPLNLTDESVDEKLKHYDILLSGHMHNGMMPPLLDKMFKGNFGIIEPDKKIFPKIARGSVKLKYDRLLIISGGVTKLSESAGIFHYGNFLYPAHIECINAQKKTKDLKKNSYK